MLGRMFGLEFHALLIFQKFLIADDFAALFGFSSYKYKSVVTVDDYLACKALGTKKQHAKSGHFIHDLQRGWVVITDS